MVDHAAWIAMREVRNVPRIVAAARVREVRRGASSICMTGLDPADGIGRTGSIPQGGPEAPREFTYYLDVAVEIFVGICKENQWGHPLEAADI
eukprot:8198780-Pyramimonas_sp.AAC.1